MSEAIITIYTPESPLRHPAKLSREMFRDLFASRELAWRLFVRDTRAQYRQSMLGYLWAFIPPLVASLPFVFLNSQGVVGIKNTGIPYAAYAMIGTIMRKRPANMSRPRVVLYQGVLPERPANALPLLPAPELKA